MCFCTIYSFRDVDFNKISIMLFTQQICKFLQNCENLKIDIFRFLLYLQMYMRYRELQYLILKLLKNRFENLQCNFLARVMFFDIGTQTCVPFFMHHPLGDTAVWQKPHISKIDGLQLCSPFYIDMHHLFPNI